MSETGFRIFNALFSIGADLMYAVCLTLFVRPFLTGSGRRRKQLLVFAANLLICALCSNTPVPQGTSGLLLTAFLTAASGVLGLERAMAFLLAVLCWNARTCGNLMSESLYFIIEHALPFPDEPLEEVFFHAAAMVTMFLLSYTVLFAVMLYALQRQLRKRKMPLHWQELCYLSLVPTAGILFGQVISRLLLEFRDGILFHLYDRYPAFLAVIPLMALLFYAGAYLTIVFQQGMAALREEQAAYFAERQQTQAIRARIREMEQFYAHIRQLKHEMRGHLTNLKGLVRSGEYGALEDYIAQMDGGISGFELTFQTGNPVTDVIVNDKRRQCQDLGVRFLVDFHYPVSGAYDAFGVGIILQNLLQNALEACEKVEGDRRFISLTGKRKGRFFLIEVRNSFVGEIRFGPDGLPVSTKREDAPMHGIGLSNVRREVEKYMGELELKAGQREFSAVVLLQEGISV